VTHATMTLVVLAAVVVLFVSNVVAVEIVAIAAALSLYAMGILDLRQTLAGFGDPAVLFIASLFVISEGLDAGSVTAWAGQALNARAGESRAQLLILTMLLVAGLTALISLNGAVAALLPMVVLIAVRRGPPSQLLIPLVFAAHAGSLLTLTGTPVNVLISESAVEAGYRGFGFFEFGLVGVPLLLGTIAIVVLFGQRLLPHRIARVIPPDLSEHYRTLFDQYMLEDGPFRLRVEARSPYVGHPPEALDLDDYPGVTVIGGQTGPASQLAGVDTLAADDVLVVRGVADTVRRLAADKHLTLRSPVPSDPSGGALFTQNRGVVEVVLPPRSDSIGVSVFPGMLTSRGDLVILAVQRAGADVTNEIVLAAGDTLLLGGPWEALNRSVANPDVLVVDRPELVRRQAVPLGVRGIKATVVLAAMVGLLATGALPEAVVGMVAACAMVLLRVLTLEQAYRAISWTTVILVAAMMPLATAMHESGAAQSIAGALVQGVGHAGPYALLVGLFTLTVTLGQLISNMAVALVVIPIAVSAAAGMGASAQPFLMTVAVAAAASFLTPVATPVNLMVKEPGGYRFGDYWKLGLPLILWFFVVTIVVVPRIWPF
jgi:di/tricarboxylate transporter